MKSKKKKNRLVFQIVFPITVIVMDIIVWSTAVCWEERRIIKQAAQDRCISFFFFFSLSLSLSLFFLFFLLFFSFCSVFLFLCRFFSLFWQKYVYWDHRVICINANALLIANIVVNTQSNWYLTITYQQKYITLFTSNCMAFQPFRTWKNPQYPP